MKLKLHHINLSSNNVKKMNDFYKNILLLDTETNDLPILERRKGYSGDVAVSYTHLTLPTSRSV